MLARVSNIEAYRRWMRVDDVDISVLIHRITDNVETEAMRAGTAFHKAMEHVSYGDRDVLSANGYTFRMTADCDIEVPVSREVRRNAKYGPLTVTGKVDAICGSVVWDHKTTAKFDAERYLDGYQWRYYLDIFGANQFVWNVFVLSAVRNSVGLYDVTEVHKLTQYRYPDMHRDCMELAHSYAEFAERYLPSGYAPDLSEHAPALGRYRSTRPPVADCPQCDQDYAEKVMDYE